MDVIAGIDWASEQHRLCLVDSEGRRLLERRVSHDEEGLSGLCRLLGERGVGRVAIERPDGLLVERLLEAGLAVVPVHPNALAAARARYQVAGGKSDGFDAYVLAELARTDMHRLRVIEPDCDETKALRALTRARQELELEARRTVVLRLVCSLRPLVEGIGRLDSEIAHAVRAHPDGAIFLSLFRDPKTSLTAAELVAEVGDSRARYPGSAPPARRRPPPRRGQPAPPPLGGRRPPSSARSRLRPSARDPHPRPRLAARDLADVAGPHPLRPRAAWRPATPRRPRRLTQGVSCAFLAGHGSRPASFSGPPGSAQHLLGQKPASASA